LIILFIDGVEVELGEMEDWIGFMVEELVYIGCLRGLDICCDYVLK